MTVATALFPPTDAGEPLAMAPGAVGRRYSAANVDGAELEAPDVAVVAIRGPLMHRRHWLFDSYEAIRGRMAEALALGASKVVLDIDSPGGLAAGCFDCARDLRKMADAAGVELVAHVSGTATSAAYALATAATRIGVSSSATLGSIGVLSGLADATKQLEAEGIRVELVGSGARKGDGHIAKPITDEAIAAVQAHVDGLAGEFFELVASHGYGPGAKPAAIRALEARVVLGAEAVELGLATEVATLSEMIGATTARERNPMQRSETLRALAVALGLAEECTDEALVEAVHAQLVPRADLEQARARATTAEEALEAQRAAAFAERADEAVASAVRSGKITPAGATYHRAMIRDAAALAAFEAHVDALPVVADDDPNDEDGPAPSSPNALTPEDREVARMLGLTDDEFAAAAKDAASAA